MFKKQFLINIFIHLIFLKCFTSEFTSSRQKLIFSLSQALFIKNIIIIKSPFLIHQSNLISLTKSFSQSKIYSSVLSKNEIKHKMDECIDENVTFSKTLILTFNEKYNDEIYELISKDELAASKFLWLVWDDENKILSKKTRYYIPHNSQLLIIRNDFGKNIFHMSEVYHPNLYSQFLTKRHFGIWSKDRGLEIPEEDLYKRRFNMNGTKLNILVDKKYLPALKWRGLNNNIAQTMDFNLVLVDVIEVERKLKNGQKVELCEIDFRPTLFYAITRKHFQLLWLLEKSPGNMYIRYDEIFENHNLATYTRPFSKELWWAILTSILIIGIFTLILIHKNNSDLKYFTEFYNPLEAFFNQDGSDSWISNSIRLSSIKSRFISLFIVPAYSAFLLTYILVPNIKLPFTDIKSLVQDGSYKIGFATKSYVNVYFRDSKDIWYKTAYEKYFLELDEMPTDTLDTFKKMCEYKKVAFIILGDFVPLTHCKILRIPTPVLESWLAFILRKNSPYTKIFNRMMKTVLSSGSVRRYDEGLRLFQLSYKDYYLTYESSDSVEIENIAPLLRLLAFLYVVAIILLILECSYKGIMTFLKKINFIGQRISLTASEIPS